MDGSYCMEKPYIVATIVCNEYGMHLLAASVVSWLLAPSVAEWLAAVSVLVS